MGSLKYVIHGLSSSSSRPSTKMRMKAHTVRRRDSEVEEQCEESRGEVIRGLLASMRTFYVVFAIFLISFVLCAFTGDSSQHSILSDTGNSPFWRKFTPKQQKISQKLFSSLSLFVIVSFMAIVALAVLMKKSKTSFKDKPNCINPINKRFKIYGSFQRDNVDFGSKNSLVEGYVGNGVNLIKTVKI